MSEATEHYKAQIAASDPIVKRMSPLINAVFAGEMESSKDLALVTLSLIRAIATPLASYAVAQARIAHIVKPDTLFDLDVYGDGVATLIRGFFDLEFRTIDASYTKEQEAALVAVVESMGQTKQ